MCVCVCVCVCARARAYLNEYLCRQVTVKINEVDRNIKKKERNEVANKIYSERFFH